MSRRTTHCPKTVQSAPVSTITRPVTQTAEVEVKRAVSTGARPGATDAAGMDRSRVPTRLVMTKARATYCAGWRKVRTDLSRGDANALHARQTHQAVRAGG